MYRTRRSCICFCSCFSLEGGDIKKIHIQVSKSIYKNGAKVFIPGSKLRGLEVAGALGALIADSERKLTLLDSVEEEQIIEMEKLIRSKQVTVEPVSSEYSVYVKAVIYKEGHVLSATVEQNHDRIVSITRDDVVLFESTKDKKEEEMQIFSMMQHVSLEEIVEFAEKTPIEKFDFVKDSVDSNMNIALGQDVKGVLDLDHTFNASIEKGFLASDALLKACQLTASAVDKRMSGIVTPVMSCGGSGNQGILASVPITAIAIQLNIDDEKLIRSLVISYLTTLYAKSYIGKLSVLCGCSIVAGVGAAAGLTWLLGGEIEEIQGAINNMISSLSGMVCDGAKEGCTLKILSSVFTMYLSAIMALDHKAISSDNGLVGRTIHESILNLTRLSQEGMKEADNVIVDIINKKDIVC